MKEKRSVKVNEGEAPALAPAVPRLAYTMKESAAVLGVSYISVHRLLKRGLLRSVPALRTKLIPAAELERFLKL